MTGIQEILTLILLIGCIFFLPRLFGGSRAAAPSKPKWTAPSGKRRLAIVLSLFLPLMAVLIFPPWQAEKRIWFLIAGVFPVVLYWAGFWVFQGFKKK